MVFAAIYPTHIKLSQKFATYGTAHYAGLADELTQEQWRQALLSLLQNPESYIKMVNAIKKMRQPQFGADHLAEKLLDIFKSR